MADIPTTRSLAGLVQPDSPPRADCPPALRLPSDRLYAVLHWTCLVLLAGLLIEGLIASRLPAFSRPAIFRLVISAMLVMNVLWWSIADRRFTRFLQSPGRSRLLRICFGGFSALISAPIAFLLLTGKLPETLNSAPTWYVSAVTLWNMGLVGCMPLVAGIRLLVMGATATFRKMNGTPHRTSAATDPDRRAILKTAVATVPIAVLGGGAALARAQEGRLAVRRHVLQAPWLPRRLAGLTITQISDLHLGRLYRPWMLRHLIEEANKLNSDIVVITGDVVDVSNDFLPAATEAFAQLTHRHGLFICMGNHDEIDDRPEFIEEVRDCYPLLINERRLLIIGGERLTIGGVDYASRDEPYRRQRSHVENVSQTLIGYNPQTDGPMIAMAHHPHAWDRLAASGVPLTLSGHTHGGQVMFTPPGEVPEYGLGRVLFRYTRGFYRKNGSTLFVNSGVGNWFPLRIHAPAEIVQIQLV